METVTKKVRRTRRGLGLVLCLCLASGLLAGVPAQPQPSRAQVSTAAGSGVHLPLVVESYAWSPSAPVGVVYLPEVFTGYEPPASVFGVQMRTVTDDGGLQAAVAAGSYWVRSASFRWSDIEPLPSDPPVYKWGRVDETSLLNAAENGLRFIGKVHYTPSWAQARSPYACGPIREDALDEFARFLAALVARYSQPPYNIHLWELWNEPDVDPSLVQPNSGYGCWGDKEDPDYGGGEYARMLKAAYPAIKAADFRARVYVGGLLLDCAPDNPECTDEQRLASRFLEGILKGGGGPFFDGVAFHGYTYGFGPGVMTNPNWPGSTTVVPEKVAFLRGVLQQYGYGDVPLFDTEAALLCMDGTPECFETQAMYVPRAYAEALALGLKGMVYYQMIDDAWRHVGLLKPDLTPKPVYYAYATAASFLGLVAYSGPAAGYPPGVEGYSFARRSRDGRVDVIWSTDGSIVQVPLPPGASAYDRYGQLLGSGGQVPVEASPVYVTAP